MDIVESETQDCGKIDSTDVRKWILKWTSIVSYVHYSEDERNRGVG